MSIVESKIKRILVPTDFSDASANAFAFAVALTRNTNATITALHIYHPSIDTMSPTVVQPIIGLSEVKEVLMDKFIRTVNPALPGKSNEVEINSSVQLGFAVEKIIRHAEKGDYDIVIMGTVGHGGALEKAIGSISSDVSQKANRPVLLVPAGHEYHGFKSIVYGCDFLSVRKQTVLKLAAFATIFRSELHFVHVQQKNDDRQGPELLKTRIYKALFSDGDPPFAFEFDVVHQDSVAIGLLKYADKINADLIVMTTQKRSFWSNLFYASNTKELALKARYPMLFFHDTK